MHGDGADDITNMKDGAADATATDERRREMLRRLGKAALYAAPVTMATLSMKASADSLTC